MAKNGAYGFFLRGMIQWVTVDTGLNAWVPVTSLLIIFELSLQTLDCTLICQSVSFSQQELACSATMAFLTAKSLFVCQITSSVLSSYPYHG